MKIKKLLSTVTLILALTLVLLAATSCSLIHKHAFSEWETVNAPTCSAFGLQKRVCECGETEYGAIAALSHTPVTDAAVDATCTTPGKTEGSHCKDCGATIVQQTETAKLKHSFSEWKTVSEPTCFVFGLNKRDCECGETEYDIVSALSHNPVTDEAVDATCTEPGKTEGSHCSACGTVIKAQNVVMPLGHSFNNVSVLEEAFCNLDGTKRYSCTNEGCSEYYDESYSLPELSSAEIYADAVQYTGLIQVFDRFGNLIYEASAFVISADGKVVTSRLVIDNAYSLIFKLADEYYDVTKILAYDDKSDIAVLQLDATDLPYANVCKRDPVDAEVVYAVGAPVGYESSITSGVISNANLILEDVSHIQHDINAESGYIGGPLLNRFGEVIGVNVGYIGGGTLCVAARSAELDALDYSSPISVEEYGNITYAPEEQLDVWVWNNYNGASNDDIAYVLQGKDSYYALGHNIISEYSFVEGYWKKGENHEIYVRVIFNNSDGTYQYYASMVNGIMKNETYGYIDAETFTESTVLTYDTYYGRFWTESELMALYSTAVYDTLGFFSYCLDTYFDTLTLDTFGFTSVSYDRDEDALVKLQNFVVANGTYNSLNDSYLLSGGSQMGDDSMIFNILYEVETGDTIVSVHYQLASGVAYSAHLTLNANENGNLFEFAYYLYNGQDYVEQSTAWGYLDANSFTAMTKLECYVFEGMNDYEDGLLVDYTSLLDYMMRLLNESVLPSIDPALDVKDLGFLFYFDYKMGE